MNKKNDKQIFEKTINAFFANDFNWRNAEIYIFKLFDDIIDWAVKKQFIVSIFIIEAKLLSMLHVDKKLICVTLLYARNVLLQARNMSKKLISFFVVSRVMTTSSSRVWRLLLVSYDSQNSTIKILRFCFFEFIFIHKKKFEQKIWTKSKAIDQDMWRSWLTDA